MQYSHFLIQNQNIHKYNSSNNKICNYSFVCLYPIENKPSIRTQIHYSNHWYTILTIYTPFYHIPIPSDTTILLPIINSYNKTDIKSTKHLKHIRFWFKTRDSYIRILLNFKASLSHSCPKFSSLSLDTVLQKSSILNLRYGLASLAFSSAMHCSSASFLSHNNE